MRNKITLILCVLAFVFAALPAYSQNTPPPGSSPNVSTVEGRPASTDGSTWEFRLIPYAWLIAMDTKATVCNYTVDSNISFSDILRNMDLAGQVHFEAQKGKWGFFIDPTYLKLSQSGTLKDGRDVRMQVEQ